MDGIVGKTYQTYNSLPPCQEIDISCHKLSQNGDFVSKYPSSFAAIFIETQFSGPRDSDFPAGSDFGPGPVIQLGLDLILQIYTETLPGYRSEPVVSWYLSGWGHSGLQQSARPHLRASEGGEK